MLLCVLGSAAMNAVLVGVNKSGNLLDTAARRRMLSQRIAAQYASGIEPSTSSQQVIERDFQELHAIQAMLDQMFVTDPDFSNELATSRDRLTAFESSVTLGTAPKTTYRLSQGFLNSVEEEVAILSQKNEAQTVQASAAAYLLAAAGIAALLIAGRKVFQPVVAELAMAENLLDEKIDALENTNRESEAQQDALRMKEEQIRLVGEDLSRAESVAGLGSWRFVPTTQSIWWSDGLYKILDLDPAGGKPSVETVMQRIHPEDAHKLKNLLTRLSIRHESYLVSYRIIMPNGAIKHIESRGVIDSTGETIRGTWLDITANVAAQEAIGQANKQLQILARTDSLTGLANRRAMDERLNQEFCGNVGRSGLLCVALLDLDQFKSYNDTFGHQAGDEALIRIAEILQNTLRQSDLPARFGGEELAIILPHTTRENAELLAERLRMLIETADWPHRTVTASFGLAMQEATMQSPDELLRAADKALYRSKAAGRNRVSWA